MWNVIVVIMALSAGCSNLLGFSEPKLREDGGTGDAAIVDGSDAGMDAGVDGPVSATGSFATQTATSGTHSFFGSFQQQPICNGSMCVFGSFTTIESK